MYIYSDASYSHEHKIGIAGCMIYLNPADHEDNNYSGAQLKTIQLKDRGNIRIELSAAIMALQTSTVEDNAIMNIELFTDCESVVKLPARRQKLEATNFISGNKGTLLTNADLYKEFFRIYDQLSPKITWVKGHTKKADQTYIERNFSFLDKAVRQELRGHCL